MPATRTTTALFFLIGSLGTNPAGAPAQEELPPDLEVDIDEAIDAGVDFLLKEVLGPAGWSPGAEFPSGYAAVQVYALVKSDVSYTHPVVQKGIAAMEGPFEKVYSVSLLLMAYGAMLAQIDADQKLGGARPAADRVRFQERIRAALEWLVAARLSGVGAWNYEALRVQADSKNFRFDHSNTQFAVLALGVAAEEKLRVPQEIWEEIADHFIAVQEKAGEEIATRPVFRPKESPRASPNASPKELGKTQTKKESPLYSASRGGEAPVVHARGWRYTAEDLGEPKFSMACAGLSSLLIAQRNLPAAAGSPRDEAIRKALRDGYGWVTQFLGAERSPFRTIFNIPYALYSLEKVGDLGEVTAFGDFRWYEEGARRLLTDQRRDGGWYPSRDQESIVRENTALSLLFLNRATEMGARSRRPLIRATGAGGAAGAAEKGPARAGWIYLPSQRADVLLSRLLRLFRYRPNVKNVMRMVDEAVSLRDPERAGEFVGPLATALERSPFTAVQAQARKHLAAITGVEYQQAVKYREWADRWAEVVRIGKAAEAEPQDEQCEKLREWLKTSDGTPLRAKVVWALQRTRARAALGEIIDLLESPDSVLREAAHGAAAIISGQSFPFDPRGTEKTRTEQVRAWREWYAGRPPK